jgi:hypothetical protein
VFEDSACGLLATIVDSEVKAMGREFIGEWPVAGEDPKFETYEGELAIKYIKRECGQPPGGVDVQITSEGYEVGNEGDEVSYPVISVVWDDGICEYPDEYIGKCIEAFERLELPEEIHQRYQLLFQLQDKMQEISERISETRERKALPEKPDAQTEVEES